MTFRMKMRKSKSKQQTGRRGGGGRGIGSTTNPKRRKTRSTSKKESFSTAEHLASATVVLTENGWLPLPAARTLCTLELTCRSTSSICLKDEAWKALCCKLWPSTGEINSNYIRESLGGYKVGRVAAASLCCSTPACIQKIYLYPLFIALLYK